MRYSFAAAVVVVCVSLAEKGRFWLISGFNVGIGKKVLTLDC